MKRSEPAEVLDLADTALPAGAVTVKAHRDASGRWYATVSVWAEVKLPDGGMARGTRTVQVRLKRDRKRAGAVPLAND